MKLILIAALLMGVVISNSDAAVITDLFKNFGDKLKDTFTNLGSSLKDTGKVLVDHAKNKVKDLLGQSLQALLGAFASTAGALGKRDLPDHTNIFDRLFHSTSELIEKAFNRSWKKIAGVIDDLVHNKSEETEILERLNNMNAEHVLAVRSIIGDTLNKGINWVKSMLAKLVGGLKSTGPEEKVSDPTMGSGKRELLSSLKETLQNIKDALKPHVDNILQITKDIASTLGHHAGKLLDQHKNAAWEGVKSTLATMKDKLVSKLQEVTAGY